MREMTRSDAPGRAMTEKRPGGTAQRLRQARCRRRHQMTVAVAVAVVGLTLPDGATAAGGAARVAVAASAGVDPSESAAEPPGVGPGSDRWQADLAAALPLDHTPVLPAPGADEEWPARADRLLADLAADLPLDHVPVIPVPVANRVPAPQPA